MAAARQALIHQTLEAHRAIQEPALGDIVWSRRGYLTQSPEIQRRLLVGAVHWMSNKPYPPRQDEITELEIGIFDKADKTLAGVRILTDDTHIRLTRELRAVQDTTAPLGETWDGRWQIDGPAPGDIRPLGADGLRHCPDAKATGCPRATLLASPAVWQGETLIAAPLAGFNPVYKAKIVADFASFLVCD